MKKFGIFLEFRKKENNLINKIKSLFFQKIIGKKIFFLEKPHLTLYTFTTNASTSVVKDIFRKLFHRSNIKRISYLRFNTFKNDLFTGLDTSVLLIKKEIKLVKLQKKIYDNFSNYFYYEYKNFNLFKKNKIILLNYKKYCFPYYGMIWIPHITIGSFDYTKNNISNLYNLNIPKNFKISSITLNLISNLKAKKILTCR